MDIIGLQTIHIIASYIPLASVETDLDDTAVGLALFPVALESLVSEFTASCRALLSSSLPFPDMVAKWGS